MIWTREQLLALNEAELRDQVLIPLFKAMGYQDVRSHHGGPLEQGKDLVMWRVDNFGTRRNSAVVAKAERIGGSASTLAGTALTQIHQALGSTFLDEVTREEHRVHEVLLVNSHDISTEALQSFKSTLVGSRVDHQVSFIWGNRLWDLLREHLPKQLIFGSLAEAQRALAEADPHHGYVIQVGPKDAHFVMVPQSHDAPPLQLFFEPNFPDTEDGRRQFQDLKHFHQTGQPVEINRSYLKIHGLPPSFDFLMTGLDPGTIRLGPSTSARRLAVALIIVPADSPEIVLLPHIEFGTSRIGTEELTTSNEQQAIPFKVTIRFNRGGSRQGTFSYDFSAAEASAFTQHKAIGIQAHLSRGGLLLCEDLATGTRHQMLQVAPEEIPHPGEEYLELWGHVAEIQRRTGAIIPAPSRLHFTDDDVSKILSVLAVLKDGKGTGSRPSLTVAMKAAGVRDLFRDRQDGLLGEVIAETPEHAMQVLDVAVPLGPVRLHYELARIPPAELARIGALADSSGDNPDAMIQLPIEPVEGHELVTTFMKWAELSEEPSSPHR